MNVAVVVLVVIHAGETETRPVLFSINPDQNYKTAQQELLRKSVKTLFGRRSQYVVTSRRDKLI